MISIAEISHTLETFAPPALAESWDNVGLIVGSPATEVTGIVVALDVTLDTIHFARSSGANLIVSHHPPIFKPVSRLTGETLTSRVVTEAVKSGIALYAVHTNLDRAPDGVSIALANRLGIRRPVPLCEGNAPLMKFVTFVPHESTAAVREALSRSGAGIIGNYAECSFTVAGTGTYRPSDDSVPYHGSAGVLESAVEDRIEMILPAFCVREAIEAAQAAHPYEKMAYDLISLSGNDPRYGYGAIGYFESPMNRRDFSEHVMNALGINSLVCSSCKPEAIRRVAVMGGSGSDYIGWAIEKKADAFITSEIGHHDFVDHGSEILLIDATHLSTETPVLETLKFLLSGTSTTGAVPVTVYTHRNTDDVPYTTLSRTGNIVQGGTT